MTKENVLIVDDEAYIRRLIKKSLANEKYSIEEASSGIELLKIIQSKNFDLIILDIMLDDIDGFELVKRIKNMGIKTPILLISGRKEDHDKILGLGVGADDYITKPFSPAVLCARVKAHIRRYKEFLNFQSVNPNLIITGPFKFDIKTYKLYKNENEIFLSFKETMLIKFLMEHPNQVFSKKQLYENIWNETIIDDNSIMVYIRHLRKKIEDNPKSPKYIVTVWGIGYKFVSED